MDEPSQEDVDKVGWCSKEYHRKRFNILYWEYKSLTNTISNQRIRRFCQVHQQYTDALCALYKEHVHKYGNPDVKLVIT